MTPIDMLADPIRRLLDAVGTGVLPADSPTVALRDASERIAATDACQRHALDTLGADWHSTASENARAMMRDHHGRTGRAAHDSSSMAAVIDDAAQTVRGAARELRTILDSFVAATDALGPTVYTPSGIAAALPIASEHLRRALAVVGRTRTQLDHHARRLMTLARIPAPGTPGDAAAIRNQLTKAVGDAARAFSGKRPAVDSGARTHSASTGAGPHGPTGAGLGKVSGPPTPGAVAITLPDGSVAYAPNQRAATAVRAALAQRGVPYQWGGTSPGRGLDCSGLTQYAYRQAGVELPRLAQDQDTAGYRVDRAELAPGDLAVWSGHVAMYVGNGQMVEAGNPVQVSPLRTTNLDQVFEGFYRPR